MIDDRIRILIVDDHGEFRKILKSYMLSLGARSVMQAADGDIAWNMVTIQHNFKV